jgi:hypothetical protein
MNGLTIALGFLALGSSLILIAIVWNAFNGLRQEQEPEAQYLEGDFPAEGDELTIAQHGSASALRRFPATAEGRAANMKYNSANHRTGLTQFSNLSVEAIRQVRQAFADLTGLGFDVGGLGVESYDPQERGTRYVVADYMDPHDRVVDLAVVDLGVDPPTCNLTPEGIARIEQIAIEFGHGARKIQR